EAALVAAELGADVHVVSDEGLGGNSVLWDCVPSKALIVAAEATGWVEVAAALGIHLGAPVPAATVDFARVAARVLALGVSQSRDLERRALDAGVTLVRGRGRLAGPSEVTVALAEGGHRSLPADHVLLATGSTP